MSAGATTGATGGVPRDERAGPADAHTREQTAQLGMWVFIASEVLFFGGLLFAYLIARIHWPEGFVEAGRHTDVLLGTVNTAVLLTSSLTWRWRSPRPSSSARRWIAPLLWATAALGLLFLAIKGVEYRNDWHEGLFPGSGFHLGRDAGPPPQAPSCSSCCTS